MVKRVGIVGCGKILPRHVEAIEANDNFSLVSLCDSNLNVLKDLKNYKLPLYADYKKMLKQENIDFVSICTPNSQHFEQSKYCLENGADVLIEKPATLNPDLIREIENICLKTSKKAYAVLQVRLNPTVQAIRKMLEQDIIGKIRGISLTQRWQRPPEYFDDWRGDSNIGGGTLHECGIHYLDIVCYLFGKPSVIASSCYNTKHRGREIEDTIYSIFDFNDFGGTMEVTISSEPKNIECSIAILTDRGFIRLGGRSLDKVLESNMVNLEEKQKVEYDKIISSIDDSKPANSYGNYAGSCPNHPDLYSRLDEFDISVSYDSLCLIKEIYKNCGREYYEK